MTIEKCEQLGSIYIGTDLDVDAAGEVTLQQVHIYRMLCILHPKWRLSFDIAFSFSRQVRSVSCKKRMLKPLETIWELVVAPSSKIILITTRTQYFPGIHGISIDVRGIPSLTYI